MREMTVKQLADASGVSIRTLHHYDAIGVLKPARVGENGYRYYGREELLRLQQILFHRELGFSLEETAEALSTEGFDRIAALKAHRSRLEGQSRRLTQLMGTIDETLAALIEDTEMNPKAMYRGFDPEKQAAYEKELVDRHGPAMQGHIDHAKAGMKTWNQTDFDALQAEFEAIEGAMAEALGQGLPPDSDRVHGLMSRHHAAISRSWNRTAPAAAFAGLGDMYLDDDRFRAHYDDRAKGLAEYMTAAMKAYAATMG